jgi:hypothetical protein
MPKQFFGPRKKLIHSVGVVVHVKYVSLNDTFTGVFKGCENVILRFSIAQEANTKGGEDAMGPGVALKFVRNNVASANVFAMYSLIGQSSFNFFAHDLSSHVPDLSKDAPTSLVLLRRAFATASDFPVFSGLSNLAAYNEDGTAVSTPVFPFRLHFHPTTFYHKELPDNYTGTPYEDQLLKVVKLDSVLYEVYAQTTPFSEELVLIGKVVTTGAPSRSFFGDKTLFYQHTRFEDDLEHYPSWKIKSQEIINYQRSLSGTGYHYPDLPWN